MVTPSSIHKELEERLRTGFTSPHVGGLFLVPYHLQLGSWQMLSSLLPDKIGGIPPQKLGLQIIHHSLYGIKNNGVRVPALDIGHFIGNRLMARPLRIEYEESTCRPEAGPDLHFSRMMLKIMSSFESNRLFNYLPQSEGCG